MFEALRYREYRLIWYAQIFAAQATWMDQVARGWLLYELTNSTLQLGLVRGVQAIPLLLLSPLAGSVADRYSRKNQVLVAQIVDGVLFAIVAALIFAGRIEPWHVYVTAFGMSVVQAFQQPSRAAMIGDAVPVSHLTNAIGLNSIIFNVARSAGPAIAGLLIAVVGTGGAYSAQAVCYFLATIWTIQLSSNRSASPRARQTRGRRIVHQEHSGGMEIQLAQRSRARQPADCRLCIDIHHSVHDALAGVCARHSPRRRHWPRPAAQRHGRRRAVQLGADRLFRRSSAAA